MARDLLKNRKVKNRGNPQNQIKNQRAEKFRQHDLPIADRRRHERLDSAEFKFLGKQTHGDERKDQHEREPEEDRIKERFLHRILHRPLIHERDLKIEIDAAHQQKENQNDVGDRRVEVTRHFAGEQGVELSHSAQKEVIPSRADGEGPRIG